MICYAYVAMHDCGRELPNDRMGVLLGVFSADSEATLWMAQHGFSERDSFGEFWKGRDRAWVTEMHVDDDESLEMEFSEVLAMFGVR